MSAKDDNSGKSPSLSWDIASTTAPERPTFASSLAEETRVGRPRRVIVAFIFVILAMLGCIALIAAAALRFEVIQDALAGALPEDLITDYSEDDIEHAVLLLVAAVAGVWFALTTVQLLSAQRLLANRSRSGRATLVVSTVLALPVAALAFILREGNIPGLAATAAVAVASLTATVIVCTPAVSVWLGQRERPSARSMVTSDAAQQAQVAEQRVAAEQATDDRADAPDHRER